MARATARATWPTGRRSTATGREVLVTDHETGWRDGGESFTFRTRPAPGKGGDKGQYDYARFMQDKLGFVYGPYNNYTDFAPVNEFWSTDLPSRTPDNQLQTAWMRCYAPKPARAVEYAARLPYIIDDKFHFSTAYCDVHTAAPGIAPTTMPVPAPHLAATFYAYGEIMLHQKSLGRPGLLGGGHHSFLPRPDRRHHGQDQSYFSRQSWSDFDLRKLHDLCRNFGMGNPGMSPWRGPRLRPHRPEIDFHRPLSRCNRGLRPPRLPTFDRGFQHALRSYFMLQQLHSRYCLASADQIRYADADGKLLETSAAVFPASTSGRRWLRGT